MNKVVRVETTAVSTYLTAIPFLLIVITMSLVGCIRSHRMPIDGSALDWIMASEIVMLRDSTATKEDLRFAIQDGDIHVTIALNKPDTLHRYKKCQLRVIVQGSSFQLEGVLSMNPKNVYLEIGEKPERLNSSPKSSHIRWTSPFQIAETSICFDFEHLDSVQLRATPIVIHLDSLFYYDDEVISLGKIVMESFSADTASYYEDGSLSIP